MLDCTDTGGTYEIPQTGEHHGRKPTSPGLLGATKAASGQRWEGQCAGVRARPGSLLLTEWEPGLAG